MSDLELGAVWISAAFLLGAVSLYCMSRRKRTGPLVPWQRKRWR